MSIIEVILLGIALSADAFAVSICKGLSVPKLRGKHILIVGAYFGIFQAIMPMIGFLLAFKFESLIDNVAHWIAFGMLLLIGANMIKDALEDKEESVNESFGFRAMLSLAVATSIDALAVGVSFAFTKMNFTELLYSVTIIGCTTFILSAIGIKIGHVFGEKYDKTAKIIGGVLLILIGLNVVLNHYGIGTDALLAVLK